MFRLSGGEEIMTLFYFIFIIQYRCVTDGRTDGQTDGRCSGYVSACIPCYSTALVTRGRVREGPSFQMSKLSTCIAISRCVLWRRSIYSADGRTDRHATRPTNGTASQSDSTKLKAGNCRSIYALQHTAGHKKERKRIGKAECRRNLVRIYIRNVKNIKEWFYALPVYVIQAGASARSQLFSVAGHRMIGPARTGRGAAPPCL